MNEIDPDIHICQSCGAGVNQLNLWEVEPVGASKYKNKKTLLGGRVFDSAMEARYYLRLEVLKNTGEILDFKMQHKFELQPSIKTEKGERVRAITYTVDFVIYHHDGTFEAIDVKGMETQQGIIRVKMFKYKYPDIPIKIITELPKKYGGGDYSFIELSELKKLRKEAGKDGEKAKTNGKAKKRAAKSRKS